MCLWNGRVSSCVSPMMVPLSSLVQDAEFGKLLQILTLALEQETVCGE